MLVDCHPVPRPAPIDVRTGAGSTQVGQLEYSSEFTQTISNAEATLALLVREGLFESQRSVEYRFLIHFASAAEWEEYFAYWASYYEPLPERFNQTIEGLAGTSGAEVVLDTICKITSFKKPG